MKFLRSKKGFTLVECVVALALFAVITASVMTVFATSRNQIQKNNDQYKIDLTANNILAAYEGSNTSGSFKKRLNSIGLELSNPGTFNKTIGTEGTGQYSFDSQNIPVAQEFGKITVKDGAATFYAKDGSAMVSFKDTYTDNKLQGEAWKDYFNQSDVKYADGVMNIEGKVNIYLVGECDYTYTVNYNGKTTLNIKPKESIIYSETSVEKPASEFENYLVKNGYYLKCIYRDYSPSLLTSYDYFYFQVFNAKDNTPVKDGKNQCLYYCVTVATNDEFKNYSGNYSSIDNDSPNAYIDFDNLTGGYKKGNVKYGYAAEGTSYQKISFSNTLKNESGNNFKGKWYFFPWLVANTDETTSLIFKSGEPNITFNSNDYKPIQSYYEYTAKVPEKSNIYYVLNSTEINECFVYNSNNDVIFTYEKNSEEALKHLVDNCGFGIDDTSTGKKKRNTQALIEDKVYDKWFHQGSVPLLNVTRVKFTDGGASGTSKIVFYGKDEGARTDSEYITFTYKKENYENFKADRDSVLNFTGDYSEFYNYSKTYNAKTLKNITNASELAPYKDKISGVTFGEMTEPIPIVYYTVSNSIIKSGGKYTHTYTYYSYEITATSKVELTSYKENSHTLEISKDGDTITCTESLSDSATVKKAYTYTITAKEQKATAEIKDTSRSTPKTPPDAVKGGTQVTKFTTDHTDKDTVLKNYKKGKPTSSEDTVNGIGGGNSTYTEIPANLDEIWTLASTPSEAAVHTVAELTGFTGSGESYDVKVGENVLFTAHPSEFSMIAGDISADTTDCVYDIIGAELADIVAETYYISRTSGDVTLIAVATYSNYTKAFELEGVTQSQEPKITIWTMPKDKAPADVKDITKSDYNKYIYRIYRKG